MDVAMNKFDNGMSWLLPLAYYTLHMPMGTILDLLKVWQISLRRTLWGFEHRFGYKLETKSKSQHIIKTRSLEAMLPTIILFVMSVSLLEQDHQEGAGAQERYKILQDVWERYYYAM